MFCSFCEKKAVIKLHYSSLSLCSSHFFRHFEKRFFRAVRKFKMIEKNDRVGIALSGGKDSIVLLHLLHKLQKKLPFELLAITIDEGIAHYREKTLEAAKEESKKLNIPLKIVRFKDELKKSLDEISAKGRVCSFCGVFRRYLLNKTARELEVNKLALGHNLDDMVQTFFLNIVRNEPLRLVRFVDPLEQPQGFVRRIRPLMTSPEKEVALYALLKNFKVGFAECPYAHQALRWHFRKQINETEAKYAGTKFKILKSMLAIVEIMRKSLKEGKILNCERCNEPSAERICMRCRMLEEVE